jgi:hypothetical protein
MYVNDVLFDALLCFALVWQYSCNSIERDRSHCHRWRRFVTVCMHIMQQQQQQKRTEATK